MKIINKITNETVATIIGGSNLTLDQALDLIGAVNVVDMDNDLYSNDGDNIVTADGNVWGFYDRSIPSGSSVLVTISDMGTEELKDDVITNVVEK